MPRQVGLGHDAGAFCLHRAVALGDDERFEAGRCQRSESALGERAAGQHQVGFVTADPARPAAGQNGGGNRRAAFFGGCVGRRLAHGVSLSA